jgi:hypothetical protein
MLIKISNLRKTYRYFGVSRAIFYSSKVAYDQFNEEGLINKKPYLETRVLCILVKRGCFALKVDNRLRS